MTEKKGRVGLLENHQRMILVSQRAGGWCEPVTELRITHS